MGSTEPPLSPPLDKAVGSKRLRSGRLTLHFTGVYETYPSVYLMCFSKKGFLSDINATYALVIIAPGAGRTQQLGFDYLYF